MAYDLAELERRLNAGEWLLPGEAAALLDVSRSTMVRLLNAGTIGHRKKPGAGQYRICNPSDVKRLLDDARREHRAD
ncbi:hypothetical protein Val02_82280 [Virgisporangium aliadipatigenens]|uniref:Helix-turn-helix domain-containing protein n=1 Tax=Virgisporangium aliadipatigenens TaxID=741659 RepID=A0A8J4DWQ5_9ACTN|nr:helix-turn-helix domain-containing protein [Virgisporangium aliadipatigenens]GIJ51342.1 hypothetical protein Val02_82280 [Virgisporangium aliadipatigenens]